MIANIIVLIFEVLYYSMFMKFARKEGKFWKYILSSIITTILLLIVGSNNLIGLLILVFSLFLGTKYIVKINVSLYDMFFVVIMLFVKIIIEYVCVLIFFNLLDISYIIVTFIFTLLKIIFLFIFKNKLNAIYIFLKNIWYKNNFYIRYIFSILTFVYTIVSIITIIMY